MHAQIVQLPAYCASTENLYLGCSIGISNTSLLYYDISTYSDCSIRVYHFFPLQAAINLQIYRQLFQSASCQMSRVSASLVFNVQILFLIIMLALCSMLLPTYYAPNCVVHLVQV